MIPGFAYTPALLTPGEEQELLAHIEGVQFQEVRMHGVAAKRTVIHYGWDYDYEGWRIHLADPIPPWLEFVVDRCAAAVSVPRERLEQLMIARYPPGATIGWHRDAPMFGAPVLGVSLLSPCTMRFRRKAGEKWVTHAQVLEPRSLYVLDGAARTQWQHSIPPAKGLRYSITVRTVRKKPPR